MAAAASIFEAVTPLASSEATNLEKSLQAASGAVISDEISEEWFSLNKPVPSYKFIRGELKKTPEFNSKNEAFIFAERRDILSSLSADFSTDFSTDFSAVVSVMIFS